MKLRDALLCLNCAEVFEADGPPFTEHCDVCGSEHSRPVEIHREKSKDAARRVFQARNLAAWGLSPREISDAKRWLEDNLESL